MMDSNQKQLKLSGEEQDLLVEIRSLIEQRAFTEALALAENAEVPSPAVIARKALVYFLQERYDISVVTYQQALAWEPDNPEWQEMLDRAQANMVSAIHEPVPDIYFFEALPREEPELESWPAPSSINIPKKSKAALYFGNLLDIFVDGLKQVWGKVAGYRDEIWTNWYRRPLFLSMLTLGYMRSRLNKFNLISTYPAGKLVGFPQMDSAKIPDHAKRFRTANGSWNNPENPLEGAVRTRFLRNTASDTARDEEDDLMKPNPRELSLMFLTRKGPMKKVPFLNMLSVAWIQFQNHDWISYGESKNNQAHEIPLSANDPARKRYWQTKLLVGKTQSDPWRNNQEVFEKTYLNECTHWWDGSQIYGSDQKTQDWLRSGQNGKLRMTPEGRLPRDHKGIEETGFVRNWWLGLGMMHTLFVKEHNAICDHLSARYPAWDDHHLFNVARLINAALMAKIHSNEWNTAINPNQSLYKGIMTNWYGLLSSWFDSDQHKKTVHSLKVPNGELGGIMGNNTENHGSPYGLTQEFVEVYRMHSLLPEALEIRRLGSNEVTNLPMPETRQAASGKCIDRFGMANLLYSFGTQNPGQLILNNYPRFMQEMSIPGNPVYDLGAVDILRARERGVPRYNAFRRAMGLKPIQRFEDLTSDPAYLQLLKKAYNNDLELIDLMIGALAEEHRPTGFSFGETIFQIFLLNATRRLQADRFFTSCYNADYYTQEGLDWIDQNNLKSVLLRHFPELAKTGLSNIQNAFEPWDESEYLDPERHPLRAFDRSLKKNPWKGDAKK
jgi:hypothetical protein